MENQPAQRSDNGLVARAKGILLKPTEEWQAISAEKDDVSAVFLRYAVPLAAIGPIASFIGMQLFGMPTFFGTVRTGMGTALVTAIGSYVLSLAGLFVFAGIANFLSPKFDGKSDWPRAFKLAAYAMTAAWVAAIFGLIPALSILSLLGLYSIYLFYKGAAPMMGVPGEKAAGYTAVTILVTIVVYVILSVVVGAITGAGAIASGGMASMDSAEQTTIDMGDFGSIAVDEENQTIDMGAFGRVEVDEDGNTTRVTIGENEMEFRAPDEAAQ